MNRVFHPFIHHFFLVFFDDILIYSKAWPSHISHVDQVIHLLSQHQRFFKQYKCFFGASKVEYLVHIIGKDGFRVDPMKIKAM
jgi:primary-amine oxidase